jgi:hypothetical protein
MLIGPSNPVGIDREDAAATDDIGLLNILTLPDPVCRLESTLCPGTQCSSSQ